MIRKFNSFNEAQFDKTADLNSTPIINTTIKYSKEILDYLKGSIEDIENSIYDCENGAIDAGHTRPFSSANFSTTTPIIRDGPIP